MVKKREIYRIYLPNRTLLTSEKFKTRKDAEHFISEMGLVSKYRIGREKRKMDKVI